MFPQNKSAIRDARLSRMPLLEQSTHHTYEWEFFFFILHLDYWKFIWKQQNVYFIIKPDRYSH